MQPLVVFCSKELTRRPGVPVSVSAVRRKAAEERPGLSVDELFSTLLELVHDYDLAIHARLWENEVYLTFETPSKKPPREAAPEVSPVDKTATLRFYSRLPDHALDVNAAVNPRRDTFLHVLAREQELSSLMLWVAKPGVSAEAENADGRAAVDLCGPDSRVLTVLTWFTVREMRRRLRDAEASSARERSSFAWALLSLLVVAVVSHWF